MNAGSRPCRDVHVRPARPMDADAIASLCTQLGYSTSHDQAARRLAEILQRPDCAVWVAEDTDGVVVGWVHVALRPSLVADRLAELGGLVVDQEHRGQGIGRALMVRAEDWARERGCGALILKSNVTRKKAHEFYASIGFHVEKTQRAFRKPL
jgi:GNAT superfamily N-acetyltransferase